VLVWSEAWNAEGEKRKPYCYFKHTAIRRSVPNTRPGVNVKAQKPDGAARSEAECRATAIPEPVKTKARSTSVCADGDGFVLDSAGTICA
jgi:hypothetical protein